MTFTDCSHVIPLSFSHFWLPILPGVDGTIAMPRSKLGALAYPGSQKDFMQVFLGGRVFLSLSATT